MIRSVCRFMFWISGWKVDSNTPAEIKRCIVLAAPHTSNWDFWYAMAALSILRLRTRFTIKKEWLHFPFSIIMKPLGAIGIDRSPKKGNEQRISHTDAMIQLFKENDELIVVITPEGTRSKRTEWKTGFWYVAKAVGVPICLGYVDYKEKKAGISKMLYPSDIYSDMKTIMEFYKNIHPKFPEKFSPDVNYL